MNKSQEQDVSLSIKLIKIDSQAGQYRIKCNGSVFSPDSYFAEASQDDVVKEIRVGESEARSK